MDDLEQKTRREFLRNILGLGTGIVVTGSILGPPLYFLTKENENQPQNHTHIPPNPAHIFDKNIEEIPFKFYGVNHTADFANSYYKQMEEMVKTCSLVVSEADPEMINDQEMTKTASIYFNKIFDLCRKYNKKVICPEYNLKILPAKVETVAGFLGAMAAIFNSNRKIPKDRREIIKHFSKIGFSYYLFYSSLFPSIPPKSLLYSDQEQLFKDEKYLYGYIVDQRNTAITEKILKLPSLLPKEEFQQGKYVLVNFGRGHTLGAQYYLKHPLIRTFKSFLYAPTYNLIDSDQIAKFTPKELGWKKEMILE